MSTGQLTADNRSIVIGGDSFVYRRFGNTQTNAPLLCLQHFRGNLDFWDPALVDRIAVQRTRSSTRNDRLRLVLDSCSVASRNDRFS